jgi:hypothetical protein
LRWGPCWYGQAAVNRPDTGSIPVAAAIRKGKPTGDGNRFENGRASLPWGFNSPSFRLEHSRALGQAAKAPAFQAGEVGSTPTGHSSMIGDRLMVGCLPLNQATKVRILLPEPFH